MFQYMQFLKDSIFKMTVYFCIKLIQAGLKVIVMTCSQSCWK